MTESAVTIPTLQQMKRDGGRSWAWWHMTTAQIVDRAGVDIVSVGDSVGINLWGQQSELEVTLDQMILACQAVRRGVQKVDSFDVDGSAGGAAGFVCSGPDPLKIGSPGWRPERVAGLKTAEVIERLRLKPKWPRI